MKFIFLSLLTLSLIACSPPEKAPELPRDEGGLDDPQQDPELVDGIEDIELIRSPKEVLIIGDSLSSGTGFAFDMVDFFETPEVHCGEEEEQPKNFVHFYARPSASPRHFVDVSGSDKKWLCKQKKIYRNGTAPDMTGSQLCSGTTGRSVFEKLFDTHNPELVVFVLGTNSIGFSASYLKQKVTKTLDQMGGRECIWVAPTMVSKKYEAKLRKTEKALEEALADHGSGCLLVKTFDELKSQKDCKKFNVSDGLHHTSCGSHLWAKTVINQVCLE